MVADFNRGLQGKLKEIGWGSLLTLMETERKTGIIEVKHPVDQGGKTARIFFRDGAIIKAFVEDSSLVNEELIYQILTWTEGEFEFIATEVDINDEIECPLTSLLLEGLRRIDESSNN